MTSRPKWPTRRPGVRGAHRGHRPSRRTCSIAIEKARRDDGDRGHRDLRSLHQCSCARAAVIRSASHFLGLHFFNPPNVIVGTELIAGDDTDPRSVDFIEAFARVRLGREMIRTADTPGLRRQPRGLQGAERGRAARRAARAGAGRPPDRSLHGPRADAARHHRPGRLGHPPRHRGQRLREHRRRGPRDQQAARLHGEADGEGRAGNKTGAASSRRTARRASSPSTR